MDESRYSPEASAVRRAFSRAAPSYDAAAQIQREISSRMASRLEYVRIEPRVILDAGCGTGEDIRQLGRRFPEAARLGFDFAYPALALARHKTPWLKRTVPALGPREPAFFCADLNRIPLRDSSVGLVWSNLVLEWIPDPLAAFREMHRVMEVDGLLMFSTLGPDTLKELHEAFAGLDKYAHVNRFIDMHDIGDMLVAAGFADPVMDMEMITVTYESLDRLFDDVRAAGARNASAGRSRGLSGRGKWKQVRERYECLRNDGRLPATLEVVYGHAWKPAPRAINDGRAIIQFDALKKRR